MTQLSIRAAVHKKIGRFLGYPECCLQAFAQDTCQVTKVKYPNGPWWGTGYVPCSDCAEKCLVNFSQFVGQHITPRREAPAPFPSEDWEGSETYFKKMWKEAKDEAKKASASIPHTRSVSVFGLIRFTW
jgi:hypothetical protein